MPTLLWTGDTALWLLMVTLLCAPLITRIYQNRRVAGVLNNVWVNQAWIIVGTPLLVHVGLGWPLESSVFWLLSILLISGLSAWLWTSPR
ncbi:hypothetical protein [Levilactobacillus namurensis]|uniref:hypothetical protein n=1 Tax=Levilactobacillus namurensis TaxID=380393 RepID=UPI001DC652C4|nr:hypothetical protein [Levilactobacillus namurensis]HJE46115.1 hypothetical protein [Levilactobacillus namurensis]